MKQINKQNTKLSKSNKKHHLGAATATDNNNRRALIDEVASPPAHRSELNSYRRFSNMATQTPTTSSKRIHNNGEGDEDNGFDVIMNVNDGDDDHRRHSHRHHRHQHYHENVKYLGKLYQSNNGSRGRHAILSSTARYYRKDRHVDLAAKYSSL